MNTFTTAMPDTVLTPLRCLPLASTATELAANLVPAEMRSHLLYKSAIQLLICTKHDMMKALVSLHSLQGAFT
jgi:hypothetical protein